MSASQVLLEDRSWSNIEKLETKPEKQCSLGANTGATFNHEETGEEITGWGITFCGSVL